jgi:SAM-dependent methyltransferase
MLRLGALREVVPFTLNGAKRVVDVGGFDGELSLAFRDRDRRFVVVDLDPEGVAAAAVGGCTGIIGSAGRLPLAAGSADAVMCLDVLEHLQEDTAVLSEVERILKPGGRVLFTTPDETFSLPLVRAERINRAWGHVRNGYSLEAVCGMCERAGLRIVSSGRYFSRLSRLAYTMLFVYRLPPVALRFRLRIFGAVVRLEAKGSWGAQEHWLVAERPVCRP